MQPPEHPDIEHAAAEADDSSSAAAKRLLGQRQLDAVLGKAQAGHDPWEYQQRPTRGRDAAAAAADAGDQRQDADVAAMEAWLSRHRPLLMAGAFAVAQGGSWVLIKGSLLSMHTPAVLTFLHLLAAAVLQLVLAANTLLPAPQVSVAAAKGALVPAATSSLQLLLAMCVLEHASVFLLLCWILVVPLLVSLTRAADVARKRWVQPVPSTQLPWIAAAAAGLLLELLLDRDAPSLLAFLLLLGWTAAMVADVVWQQVKLDATLGHTIMEPDFLFRARELSDLEDTLSPSSKALLTATLPALPVLLLGLVSLEAKDLVDHEPSVPTLETMLLSCLAFAAVHSLQVLMAGSLQLKRSHSTLLQGAAAVCAVVFELLERSSSRSWCLLGVALCIAGCCGSRVVQLVQR